MRKATAGAQQPGVIAALTSGPFGQGILALVLLGGTLVALFSADKLTPNVSVAFVGGLIVLMLALGGLASLLASISLSEHRDAFGLPGGTIRALLALGLMVVFVVFGLGNVEQMEKFSVTVGGRLTSTTAPTADAPAAIARYERAGLLAIPSSPSANGIVEIKLYRRSDPTVAVDLTKQLMTTLATLLTTVVGFYFGSRSSGEGAGASQDSTAGVGVAADVTLASRELATTMDGMQPTIALIEELRSKAMSEDQRSRATPLQSEVDRQLAEVQAAKATVERHLQVAKTAAEAASTARDTAKALSERDKAIAALRDGQSALSTLRLMMSNLEQATAALRDATAEG